MLLPPAAGQESVTVFLLSAIQKRERTLVRFVDAKQMTKWPFNSAKPEL